MSSANNTNASRENSTRVNVQKFSSKNKSLGVFEFIQKVEAKAKAFVVSHDQLFQSACQFFDGFAAKWFLSQSFCNWNDVKEKLISDFVQVDYLQNLLDTIQQRKQTNRCTFLHSF